MEAAIPQRLDVDGQCCYGRGSHTCLQLLKLINQISQDHATPNKWLIINPFPRHTEYKAYFDSERQERIEQQDSESIEKCKQ